MENVKIGIGAKVSRKLIVVDDPISGKAAGGVQLLATTLARQGVPGLEVVRSTSDQVLEQIMRAPEGVVVTVYVQKSGSLSRDYSRQAHDWLTAGARVVEKNVFARASRFRPRHRNYHMSLMSTDGAYRFVLRSLFVLPNNQRQTYLHLSLPTFEMVRREDGALVAPADELTLLRIGRPDPIKWSEFERDFAINLARSSGRKVRLIRVGYPILNGDSQVPGVPSLTIEDRPYAKELSSLYSSAHIYLHHSRIGETFGNTLAEAKRVGLPVIMGVDLFWDCAGIELLDKRVDVVGEPKYLSNNAVSAVERVMAVPGAFSGQANTQLSPADFVELLTGEHTKCERPLPSVRDSISYLWRLMNIVEGSNVVSFVRALVIEPVRSIRHALRLDA